MVQSKATSVSQYLAELPPDRRAIVEAVRKVVLENLGKGFEEGMTYGMIGYYVPHSVYPPGYHCDPRQPLPFAGLASQKNHLSLYLMSLYGEGKEWDAFQRAWVAAGKKLDMGKCCVRFKKLEDVALDVVGDAIRRVKVKEYIARYEEALRANNPRAAEAQAKRAAGAAPAKKSVKSAAPAKASKKAARKSAPAVKPAAKKRSAKPATAKKAARR